MITRQRHLLHPEYLEEHGGTWVGRNALGLTVRASTRLEAKRALIAATMAKLQSMSRAEVDAVLGEAEVIEVDPATDCLTQRLLDEDAPLIPGASRERMEEIRRRLVGVRARDLDDLQDRLHRGEL